MKPWWFWKIGKGILLFTVAVVLVGGVVMLLWNAMIPSLFKGPELSFLQAAGLLVLTRLLFHGWRPWRYGHGWHRGHWRKRFEEKVAAMTPEERERYQAEWKRRCGWYPGEPQETKQ